MKDNNALENLRFSLDEAVLNGHLEKVGDGYRLTEAGKEHVKCLKMRDSQYFEVQAKLLIGKTLLGISPYRLRAVQMVTDEMLTELKRLHEILARLGINPTTGEKNAE